MKLDASKSAGALVGGAVAQIACASLKHFASLPLDSVTESSITILCIFLASHLIPNELPAQPVKG
jgi:hypothetical protein